MSTARCRRFTLADGTILVAAMAAGLAVARAYGLSVVGEEITRAAPIRTLMLLQGVPSALVAMPMVALIPIRLRRPRPGFPRMARQPGFVACCAGTVGLGLGGLSALIFQGSSARTTFASGHTFSFFWSMCTGGTGPVVLGAWLLLALSGRWRPEPGWIDRLGRLLGAFWIVELLQIVVGDWLLTWLPTL